MLASLNHKIVVFLKRLDSDRFSTRLLRALYCTTLEINNSYLVLHAKSLVYTTLVSLVPMLAISFSLLKYLGIHNQLAPFMQNLLHPLGQKGEEISNYIVNFIDNVDVSLLGIVGTLLLLYTVVSTIVQVEETLNHIWKVSASRAWWRRILYYLGISILSPPLIFVGILLTASLTSTTLVQTVIDIEPFGTLYLLIMSLVPYFSAILVFTLLYLFLPNTKVRLFPAIVGGTAGGVSWKLTGYFFTLFVKHSSNYDVIYSGFAALFVFLLWLYVTRLTMTTRHTVKTVF